MSKKFFWGKKYVLTSGREVDMSCEEEEQEVVSILALLNHLDPVHETTKPISVRVEWSDKNSDGIVSIECRGGAPGQGRPVTESEMPVEGLNGTKDKLKFSEIMELLEAMHGFHGKVRSEMEAKVSS
jgi:hypothetical protein